jgi:hypothetical protein
LAGLLEIPVSSPVLCCVGITRDHTGRVVDRHGSGAHRVLAVHGWFSDRHAFDALLPHLDEDAFTVATTPGARRRSSISWRGLPRRGDRIAEIEKFLLAD